MEMLLASASFPSFSLLLKSFTLILVRDHTFAGIQVLRSSLCSGTLRQKEHVFKREHVATRTDEVYTKGG